MTNPQTNSTPFLEWPYYGYETQSDPFATKKIEEWKSRYPNKCGAKEVYCSKDKVCISENNVCDGYTHCTDREDERNCHPEYETLCLPKEPTGPVSLIDDKIDKYEQEEDEYDDVDL